MLFIVFHIDIFERLWIGVSLILQHFIKNFSKCLKLKQILKLLMQCAKWCSQNKPVNDVTVFASRICSFLYHIKDFKK